MALEITGERTLPGVWHERYWHQRHVATYRFAAARCRRLQVVDAGCGEGYGADLLARSAAAVTGVELVAEVVEHARARYPRVRFAEADVCAMPFPDASVDAVVCLQVIEHLWDIGRFLDEVDRVLRPGGELYCATPNRLTFTPGGRPTNPFHTVEFTAAELAATLATRFRVAAMLGVHHGWRLRFAERGLGTTLPQRLLDQAPRDWPRFLRRTVDRVRADDFLLLTDGGRSGTRSCRLDDSLDLLAVATKPRGSP